MVTVHLYLLYIVRISVKLVQSYVILDGHLKVFDHWFFVRFPNLNAMDESFSELHPVLIFVIFNDSFIQPDSKVIRIPLLHARRATDRQE